MFCFTFFCSFTLLVCGEKNILPRSRSRSEPGVFGLLELEPEPLEKNTNSRSRSHLGKKSGAGAAWKKSQEPEPLKNLPAPQPWYLVEKIWSSGVWPEAHSDGLKKSFWIGDARRMIETGIFISYHTLGSDPCIKREGPTPTICLCAIITKTS